jgi:hypothetical protein
MRVDMSLEMPDALHTELELAAGACGMRPAAFAAQAIEATLATRRLDRLTEPGRITSPRMTESRPDVGT